MIAGIRQYDGLNITFQVTEDCNMECRYCYEVSKRPKTLKLETAKKFIDMMLSEEDPVGAIDNGVGDVLKSGLVIDFIGGDALMVPELCDEILQYFQFKAYELDHKWKNRWRASISTNGTLLDKPNVLEFLEKYKGNISLGISIDGCPELHDKNRKMKGGGDSFDKIIKNWDYYKGYMGDACATKATLNKDSIPYISESIKYLHEILGLKYINMNFVFEDMKLAEEDLIRLELELKKSIEYVLEHRDDVFVGLFDQRAIGSRMTKESSETGYCGAGVMPCLTVDGKIYPCFRFTPNTMHDYENLDFNVGNVDEGFINKSRFGIVKKQHRCYISEEKCLECEIESACMWCIGGAFSESGTFYRQTNICEITKLLDKYSRLYWEKYTEAQNGLCN